MSKQTIIQILGNNQYREVEFVVGSRRRKERAKLSSIALYNTLKNHEEIEVRLYIPESVVVHLYEDPKEAIAKIKPPYPYTQDYIANLNLGLDENFKVRPIPSLGAYKRRNGYEMVFNNYIDNIIVQLTSELLSVKGELIVDISTGLNS